METKSIRLKDIKRDWYLIDAEDQILGRLASRIAQIVRGKHKPSFTPHMDMGDFVIVINSSKIKVSGNKKDDKIYFTHSGFPGGSKETSLKKMLDDFPDRVIKNAIKGMLPHNSLGRKLLTHVKVYKDGNHPHSAQKPQVLEN
tara:strand:+ start:961 stop:1389 length:429 start_codon:yes stop_codon:yes gene_type:complete